MSSLAYPVLLRIGYVMQCIWNPTFGSIMRYRAVWSLLQGRYRILIFLLFWYKKRFNLFQSYNYFFFETRFGVLIFCPDKPRKVVPRIVRIERKSFYIQLAYIASIYIRTNSIYIIAEIEPRILRCTVLSGFNGVFAAVIPIGFTELKLRKLWFYVKQAMFHAFPVQFL